MWKNKNRGYQKLDSLGFKLETGLLKLVESLERKKARGEWIDHLMAEKHINIRKLKNPILQHSSTPMRHFSLWQ
jgi:hypothetical protein